MSFLEYLENRTGEKPDAVTFDFSGACIKKIALANSEKRADELAKDLNGFVWNINEIVKGLDKNTPIYLILAEEKR